MDLGIAGLGEIAEVVTRGRVAIYNATRGGSVDLVVQVIDCTEPTFLERFSRERELLLSLSRSPRIVTIHEAGTTASGDPYLLLDPTHPSLEEVVVAEGPMSQARAGRILAAIAEAVADAHLIGIVHRGVDPTAIRRSSEGAFQLTDFFLGDLDALERLNDYRAPEARRATANRIGAASDVYSLGATMLHAVTGKSPSDPDALESVPPGPGRDLIVAAMDFDPARRPSSLELQKLLSDLTAHPGTRSVDPGWAPPEAGPGSANPAPPSETVLPVPIDETSETVDLADVLASSPGAAEEWRAAVGGPTGAEARAKEPRPTEPAAQAPEPTLDHPALALEPTLDHPALAPEPTLDHSALAADQDPAVDPIRAIDRALAVDPALAPDPAIDGAPVERAESELSGLQARIAATRELGTQPLSPAAPSPSVAAVSSGAELEAEGRPLAPGVLSDAAAGPGPRYDLAHQPRTRTELLDDIIWRVRSFAGLFIGMLAGAALLAGAFYVVGQRSTDGDDVAATVSTAATLAEAGSVVVPVVGELDREAATARLDNAGLNVEVTWEFHPRIPRGQVLGSEPMSGESAPVGSTVSLVLSRGTEPSCVGATEAAARRQLEDRGLKVAGLTRSDNDSIDEDLVVRCLIYDDTETAVIIVSDGPREPAG